MTTTQQIVLLNTKFKLSDDDKKEIIKDLNNKVGSEVHYMRGAFETDDVLCDRKKELERRLQQADREVPKKIESAITRANSNSEQIENLRNKVENFKEKVETFLNKSAPLRAELDKRLNAINRLEQSLTYLKSYEKIEDISRLLKLCNDEEQVIQLYGELKEMCVYYDKGHRATYVKEYTHYWHKVLKDKYTKLYEDVLKQLKWPFTSPENSPPPKEILARFTNFTRYLFLLKEPEDMKSDIPGDSIQEHCLPVKILLKPLKKRFQFHFSGSRQTARIDRPEWFLTQTLTWIKDHQIFVKNYVQPVADKLNLKDTDAVEEFIAGLIALAAERLHTVLGLYHTKISKGDLVDVDAAFAHAVDETLGFHRELVTITGNDLNSVISVLTKAETFVRWLAVERKYALTKMDEMLDNEQWIEPVAAGLGSAVGTVVWVPRGADWFIALLKTIEDRYAVLPQPGHRLQFLELQLELIEEWRVRLTQLLGAAIRNLQVESFLIASSPHPLTAVINAAHHTRTVLLQWAHSLHYLQLHYYRQQFQQFTQQYHHDATDDVTNEAVEATGDDSAESNEIDETPKDISLKEVEISAEKLALNEVSQRNSILNELNQTTAPITNFWIPDALVEDLVEEAGIFSDAPSLLAHLRDAGLAALAEHILLEFKAGLKDYKKQKWHAMLVVEELALSVSGPLCRPLSGLCARLATAAARLAPALSSRLRVQLASIVDTYIYEEVVLETWFNTGGTMQFTHDVKRNLLPAFAPSKKVSSISSQLPKLVESCTLLNMDYDDARRLRSLISKQSEAASEFLISKNICHISPEGAYQILCQRSDLSDNSSPTSVMELF